MKLLSDIAITLLVTSPAAIIVFAILSRNTHKNEQ